jgi:hypothetical protein
MKASVYCTTKTIGQAGTMVDELKLAGFTNNDLSALLPDKRSNKDFAHEHNTKSPEGATAGGVAGLGVGAALGWLAGIGSLAIPGVGPFIAAGPLMAALGCSWRRCRRYGCGWGNWCANRYGHSRIQSETLRRQDQDWQHSDLGAYRRRQTALYRQGNFQA